MAAARKWREDHHPAATTGHMPFEGHRNCAEWPIVCDWCHQLRSEPCSSTACPVRNPRIGVA